MSQTIQKSDSSSEKTKSEHPWNAPKYLKQKKENRDLEVYQQAILIALLNQFAEITIERPTKLSKVSLTSPKVAELKFCQNDAIDVSSLVERQCKAKFVDEVSDGLNRGTALRRMEKNKKVFVQNLLIDLLNECGFYFETSLSRCSGKAMQIERLKTVFYNNRVILTKDEIVKKGQLLNNYLFESVNHNGSYTFSTKEIKVDNVFCEKM